jgi:hypothetical protein
MLIYGVMMQCLNAPIRDKPIAYLPTMKEADEYIERLKTEVDPNAKYWVVSETL